MRKTRLVAGVLASATAVTLVASMVNAPAQAADTGISIDSKATGPAPAVAGAVKGGTVNVIGKSDFNHFDPTRIYDTAMGNFGRLISRSLTGIQQNGSVQKLVGDLAADTGKPSNGAKTWTFKLRSGIKWEDGVDVKCADVVYGISRSFDSLADSPVLTGGPSFYLTDYIENKTDYKGPYATPNGSLSGLSCSGSGDNESITINLTRPVSDFNFTTTMLAFSAVRKDKDTKAAYDLKPLSDGPYVVESRVKKDKTVIVRNKYWVAASDPIRNAYFDRVEMLFNQDPEVTNQLFINDSGDAKTGLGRTGAGILTQNIPLVYDSAKDALKPQFEARGSYLKTPVTNWLAINTEKVSDLNLRKAIQCAINKETIRAAVGGKTVGDYTNSVIPDSLGGYSKYTVCTDNPAGDVAKAKAFYAKSKQKSELTFVYGNGSTDSENEALALQASLTRAGIKVKIKSIDSTTYYDILEKQGADAPDLMMYGWMYDWPNASTIFPPLFTSALVGDKVVGENKSRVTDKTLDAMMDKAAATTFLPLQNRAWEKIDKYVVNTIAAVVPLWQSKSLYLTGSKIVSQDFTAMSGANWANLYLKN
jgi:peptide/nickel transport system substrate-binding protein